MEQKTIAELEEQINTLSAKLEKALEDKEQYRKVYELYFEKTKSIEAKLNAIKNLINVL